MNKKWLLGSAVLLLLVGSLLYWWPVLADTTPSTCPQAKPFSSKCIFNDNGALLIQTQNGNIDLKLATSTAVQNITIDTSPINGNIYLTTKANGSTTENYIYFNRRSPTTYGLSVSASGFLYHDGNRLVIEDGRTYSIRSQNSNESNFSGALMEQEGEFMPLDFKGRQIFTVSSDPTYWGFSSGDTVVGLSSIYDKSPLVGQLAFVRKGTTTTSTQQLQFRFNDSGSPLNWGPWREICDYSNNCHNFINVLDDSNTGDVVIYQDPDLLISSGLKIASTSSLLNCTVLSTVSGEIICGTSTPGGGDNLGDHTATQNIRLNKHWLSYDGDDEGVFVDQDGNVGIGTTSPATKLHLYDGSSGPIISLSGSDVNYRGLAIKNKENQEKWFVGNNTSNNFVIRATGANDILTVSSTGNVGIGTSSPNVKLTVQGNIKASGLGGTGNRCLYADANGLISATTSNCGSAYSAGNGLSLSSTTFSLAASGTNNYITKWTGTNTLGASTIYDNGTNVGIGTDSPGSKLDVAGVVSASTGFRINNSNALAGSYLRGNGLSFVAGNIQASDVPTLNQNTTGSAYYIVSRDTRDINDLPRDFAASNGIKFDFKKNTTNGLSDGGTYNGVMTWRKYGASDDFSGGPALQLAYTDNSNLWTRISNGTSTWADWIKLLNSNTGVMLQTATPGTAQTGNLNISGRGLFSGNVGIGTNNPGIKLAIGNSDTGLHWLGDGQLAIYSNNRARIEINPSDSTGITVRGNDNSTTWATLKVVNGATTLNIASGSGKIDAGTVDPLYTIGGKRYATYMSGMTGVKEETSGVLTLDKNSAGLFMAKLDFIQSPEGSDLWLFGRTTNIINNQEHFNEITCLLTPNFSGETWYEKDWGSKSLTIFARPDNNQRERVEVSYRLTAPRFDSNSWNNYSSSESEGFNLDQLLK